VFAAEQHTGGRRPCPLLRVMHQRCQESQMGP
jgi:hypothetical protein